MIPLTGYADRLSVRPGETIAFKVSSTGDAPYEARLVRVICADPNPAGPGIREEPVEADFAGSYPSRAQRAHLGSYVRVDETAPFAALPSFTLVATIWPTLPGRGEQGVICRFDPETGRGFGLALGGDGRITLILGEGAGKARRFSRGEPLEPRTWYRVWVAFDGSDGRLIVGCLPVDTTLGRGAAVVVEHSIMGEAATDAGGPLLIGAVGGAPATGHFNGKIERPQVFDGVLPAEEIGRVAAGGEAAGLVARWDFSREISSTKVVDTGPHGLDGQTVNMPARAMTGSNWSGGEMCWRHAPEQYGAIHFHDDDLHDCGWETDFSFTVPEGFRSGVYAARLTCGAHEDTIPFVVCPPRGTGRSDLCVLISTFTYTIYGNHARPDFSAAWQERVSDWEAFPWNPAEHRDYGLSTYNFHSDGSGICHASWLRPMLTLRSGYITFPEPRGGSGLRHFQADSHLLAWLEAKGFDFDVITDLELHEEGAKALAPYRTLMTGSHPEYHTTRTLDALETFRDRGGRFMYLGGNGFYWRVALHKEKPGVIEIRRGEGGIRAWAAEPGEYYNAFDGAYGGLWRRNGRPPQRLAGVGFTAQGIFEGNHYERRPEADDPRVRWMFEGIEDTILGDFGLCGGGAAGFELDRADHRLGTPRHALVVASSAGHRPEAFVLVPEEMLTHITTWAGKAPEKLVRADITFFEAPNNGAVFSVGSITFCGSLPHNDFDNAISRLVENVLRRSLDPAAEFPMPG